MKAIPRLPGSRWSRFGLLLILAIGLFLARGLWLSAAPNDYAIAQKPLYLGEQVPPLMMMVMSRDERLFTKAYSDYSDLDGDGRLDTTYTDTFPYAGYFDSGLCYTHSSNQFKASGVAAGPNGHSCAGSSAWSGNFLNWVTMSRLDILRYVMYGGKRSTDSGTQTVLERAHIPNDLHAWVKVYTGSDIGSFTPFNSARSFCNASFANTGTNAAPVFRVAEGAWSEWAATSLYQCATGRNSDTPSSATSYTVRVEVCDRNADETLREGFCRAYNDGTTTRYKPAGLLQEYGETNRLRFGMISGSYGNPRSGGVLRRNIGRFAGNGAGCAAGNEIDLSTGSLCNQGDGDEGIINALDRFRLTQWNGWTSDSKWSDCGDWGILNRQGQGRNRSLNNPGTGSDNCSAWGNPIAEMYAEALRYIAGESSPTSAFNSGSDLAGLPSPAWLDPYRTPGSGGNSYCADCNILVMSSSLPSFDSDEIPHVPRIGAVDAATDAVGTHEGISGNYLVGRVGATPLEASINTHEDVCSAENVSALSLVRGVCPDIPSLEGSYQVAGLAHKARTTDLRPGLQGKPATHINTATTYAVALSDNLPKFDIPLGDRTISLAPLCQANASGTAAITDGGWRTCALGSVGVGTKTATVSPRHVYGRDLVYDAAGNTVAGSFSLVWEDSLWGNDHDNDVVSMLTYCVGTACNANTNPNNTGYNGWDICWRSDSPVCGNNGIPTVAANEVLVRIENLSAYAGNGMLTGFAVTGSNNDGVFRLARRPGGNNCGTPQACDSSILTSRADPPTGWDKPKVVKFSAGSSDARVLESPLWYAAKYGGFSDANSNGMPDAGEWDSQVAGQPDNYFFARDPSKLKDALEEIFEKAAAGGGSTGGGGAGARIGAGSFTLETSFDLPADSTDWTGELIARRVANDGTVGQTPLWLASHGIPGHTDREIFATLVPTTHTAAGAVQAAARTVEFQYVNLGDNVSERNEAIGLETLPTWMDGLTGEDVVAYLRGSALREVRNGGKFRDRSSLLGDIVNSDPEVSLAGDNYGYAQWHVAPGASATITELGESYEDYLASKAGRDTMVYVGANDGMLHAFRARETGAREMFAYIPSEARRNLKELANPNYGHLYYVDGGITVSDVAVDDVWRTVLVGSTGAGGRSVFGLDVSNPGSFGDDDVRWEIAGSNEPGLGYVMGDPVVVPVSIGGAPRWVAMFGNGPNSVDGLPTLYIVDVWSGEILARLRPSDATYSARNGLMNIAPIAVGNQYGLVDTVYGGDLQGNVWKFDLSAAQASAWAVAFNGAPLFTAERAEKRQPITGGIEVSRGPGGGVSLFFGTGRYFEEGDNANVDVQSLYGIWDNGTRISGRSVLVEQTMTVAASDSTPETRNVSSLPVSYVHRRGWFVDLAIEGVADGERVIGTPTLQSGRVFFTTYRPTATSCGAGGGRNWLYGLNLLTGAGSMSGVTTTPGGGAEDSVCEGDCGGIALNPEDKPAPPTRNTDVYIPPVTTCDPSDPDCTLEERIRLSQCALVLRATGADPLFMPRPCGRQSWRQVR